MSDTLIAQKNVATVEFIYMERSTVRGIYTGGCVNIFSRLHDN